MESREMLINLPFFNKQYDTAAIALEEDDFKKLYDIVLNIQHDYEADHTYKEYIAQSYLYVLLLKCKALFDSTYSKPVKYNRQATRIINQFKGLIEVHFKKITKGIGICFDAFYYTESSQRYN